MKINIYQVNSDRDAHNVKFFGYDMLEKFQGTTEINSAIYDKVYSGSVKAKSLEDVYRIFNQEHPAEYQAHSLSVSDVVQVVIGNSDTKCGFYFCDSFGFKQIAFEPNKAKERDTIKAIFLEPGKEAKAVDILYDLKDLQYLVRGSIEVAQEFEDDACIICNAEGKLQGLPENRALREPEKTVDLPYSQMTKAFREAESKDDGMHTEGYIIFSQDSFDTEYPLEARTYAVSSNNKAFQAGMGGYSIYGSSLDGSDPIVRLDAYMADEKGGKDGWKIERCYMKEPGAVLDYLAGNALIIQRKGEDFTSLSVEQMKHYMETFRFPEHITLENGKACATPYNPQKQTDSLSSIVDAANRKKAYSDQMSTTLDSSEPQR